MEASTRMHEPVRIQTTTVPIQAVQQAISRPERTPERHQDKEPMTPGKPTTPKK
jgi:hypothetical protein